LIQNLDCCVVEDVDPVVGHDLVSLQLEVEKA